MASRRCQSYPSNVAEFKQTFPNHERNTVHSIPRSIAGASGSRWTAAHLESCRVILSQPQQANEHLEILQPYLASSRLHIDTCPEILQSLTFVSAKTLRESTSAELRRMGGHFGAFYSRLAEVVRMPPLERRVQPSRDINRPERTEYVTGEGLGFSSPLGTDASTQVQSSPFAPSDSDPTERSDHELRIKHEVVTASMTAEFISIVLDICFEQLNPTSRIEFSAGPTTYKMRTRWLQTTCQDDGSVICRHKSAFSGYWVPRGYPLAIVESKAAYTSWNEDEDSGQVSTNVLAQQVCEMVTSTFQRSDIGEDDLEDLSQKARQ